jgi:Xaa-Pro aminopeptidase
MDFGARREKVRKAMRKIGVEALLVTDFTNVTYLTGFTGDDSYLLVREDGETLLTDGRYTTQLSEECPGLDLIVRKPGVGMLLPIVRGLKTSSITRLAIEADSMTVGLEDKISDKLPTISIMPTVGLVEKLRLIKDKEEIELIRKAVWQAEKAFGVIRASMQPGMTEKQICDALEHQFRVFGAKGAAFPSIVAVGAKAALPHATPGEQIFGENDAVLFDWGAKEGLYNSDLTRTLVTGKIPPKYAKVYKTVLDAQRKGIEAIRPGVLCQDVDDAARSVVVKAGFGRRFNHGLGHGLGLQVHEAPRLVVTVEPGIYIPGWGGVRIEDDVLVTRNGHEVLSHVPKELEEMIVD